MNTNERPGMRTRDRRQKMVYSRIRARKEASACVVVHVQRRSEVWWLGASRSENVPPSPRCVAFDSDIRREPRSTGSARTRSKNKRSGITLSHHAARTSSGQVPAPNSEERGN